MLKLQTPPDEVFPLLACAALRMLKEDLAEEKKTKPAEEDLKYPEIIARFGYVLAATEIDKLISALDTEESLQVPTDHHLLLLYRALSRYSEWHNETIGETGPLEFGMNAVGRINLHEIENIFLGDLEYLTKITARLKASSPLSAKDLVMEPVGKQEALEYKENDSISLYSEGKSYPFVDGGMTDTSDMTSFMDDDEDDSFREIDDCGDDQDDDDDENLGDHLGDDEENWDDED